MKLYYVVLALTLLIVTYYDVRWRRIPNYFTLPLLAVGLAANAALASGMGLDKAFWGMMVGGGCFALFYAFKMMGAGDVKLMAAVGAGVGIEQILPAMFYTVVAGGVVAAVQLIYHRVRRGEWLVKRMDHVTVTEKGEPNLMQTQSSPTVPYAFAISLGTLLVLSRIL